MMDFKAGDRVYRPDARFYDFAYGRTGTVVEELIDGRLHRGVRWDGSHKVFEYPLDGSHKVFEYPPDSRMEPEPKPE